MLHETKSDFFSDKVFPFQYKLLNYLFKVDKKKLRCYDFYNYQPFERSQKNQYPGNIIQYLLLILSDVDTSVGHGGYQQAEWLEYKKIIFEKICFWLSKEGVTNFEAKDCATSLYRIAVMLTNDLKMMNVSLNLINNLLTQLLAKGTQANPQDFANSLWAIAKLVEAGQLAQVHSEPVNGLIAQLHTQRTPAKPQELANSLWAVAKLVEAGLLEQVNSEQINGLIAQLHTQRTKAKPQDLTNGLWVVAKLVEAGLLEQVNSDQVNGLIVQLHAQCTQARPQELANGLWASGILSTIAPLVVPGELITKALASCTNTRLCATQLIMGIGMLGLEEHYDISKLIVACTPQSKLKGTDIAPYIHEAKEYQKEKFISGFFVDLFVLLPNGEKKIIEFDGHFHEKENKRRFDAFRDQILSKQGYTIQRIKWTQPHPNAYFQPPKDNAKRGEGSAQKPDVNAAFQA